MATNPYFNHHFYTPTQDLVEDLTIEFIQSMGSDLRYIPREIVKLDNLFGEDVLSEYDEAYTIEMYWDNSQDWGGQGRFFSKFGLQDQRQIELIVSRKRFNEEVTANRPEIVKPRVGDIVLLQIENIAPFNITWVEEYSLQQRQLNKPYSWKLTCELLQYSHEDHNTGVDVFDSISDDFSNLNSVLNIPMTDNETLEQEKEVLKDKTIGSPFGEY